MSASARATAGNLFNRIPGIIAARPGIVSVCEMSLLKPTARPWPEVAL